MSDPSAITAPLHAIVEGRGLSADEMRGAVLALMDGGVPEALTASFLTALRMKGETVDELVGAARAMRERATRIPCRSTGLLDTCGTGGDRLRTFNVSTASAFVAAACGVPVAKHGNRSVSSTSGSADVLEALGVRLDLSPQRVARCVDDIGIGFCFAPLLHGAMKHIAPVRRQLGFRTMFNLLGPLTNPAGADFQLIGTHHVDLGAKMAETLVRLGARRALVVVGGDGLDEVSLWGETTVFEVGPAGVTRQTWNAARLGLPECDVAALSVSSPTESANVIRAVFAGESGPRRDIVVANTAAALVAAGRAALLAEGVAMAAAAIDTGAARTKLQQLVEQSHGG